mgnify:CR=1 FL=1
MIGVPHPHTGEAVKAFVVPKPGAVLDEEVLGKRKPFLGLCLGMQLLAGTGMEHGKTEGFRAPGIASAESKSPA